MMAADAKKVWMDGKLVDGATASVHVLSHTLHYGVGVFEGIRCYETRDGAAIFRLDDHIRRLIASARVYRMPMAYSHEQIARAIVDTQVANDFTPSYIRPIVYRGEPALGVKNQKGKVSLAIAAIPAKKYLGENSDAGVRAKISPFRKFHSDAIPSYAKSCGNYINSYLAGIDAAEDGYEEAILLDHNGFLAEGTGENMFLVRDGVLYTPGPESDILMGITRASVLELARDQGITCVEKLLTVNELLTADEAFFSGTYAEIAPIREVGHYVIGNGKPGRITRSIQQSFYKVIRGEEPRYAKWLHPVAPVPRAVSRSARASTAA
jgi:branched-chain amino acid aminotransferase